MKKIGKIKTKKGVELTLNTMIMAILVLIVLAVMIYFVVKIATGAREGILCEDRGYNCVSKDSCKDQGSRIPALSCDEGMECCWLK
ncbi:MAG: hypothetical protein ABII01_06470 [Candidatus Woesearchaeota archaeon]